MSLFYLIVIIAPRVKIHSLLERNVQENALIVDHYIKKSIYIPYQTICILKLILKCLKCIFSI